MIEIEDLEVQFPLTRRILSKLSASLVELHDGSSIRSLGERTVAVYGDDRKILAIRLDALEKALTGFRDTGTWGDIFPPATDNGSE